MKLNKIICLVLFLAFLCVSCAPPQTNTGKGGAYGATGGAVAGAIIGQVAGGDTEATLLYDESLFGMRIKSV